MKPKVGMFIPTGKNRWSGSRWFYRIVAIDDEAITLQLYDSPYSEPQRFPYWEIDSLVMRFGLWERTGLYQFNLADDPATPYIRMATLNPKYAGQRIYELEQKLDRMD